MIENIVSVLPGLALIAIMYVYMFVRLNKMLVAKANREYKPNAALSGIEMISFILVYYLAVMVTVGFDIPQGAGLMLAILALVMSFFIFTEKTVKAFGFATVCFAILVYGVFLYCVTGL